LNVDHAVVQRAAARDDVEVDHSGLHRLFNTPAHGGSGNHTVRRCRSP
jgi:hypothetical protein